MKRRRMLVLAAAIFLLGGCDNTQEIVPQTRGQRGESCLARNDCKAGLACIAHVCSKNDFDIDVSAKHCDLIECSTTEDCCGGRPSGAPSKCAGRAIICGSPYFPDCESRSCTSHADCSGGACLGMCSDGYYSPCATDSDCSSGATCEEKNCDCSNPEYDPNNPICWDEDCFNVCTLRCEKERCVQDTSCTVDSDCYSFGLSFCGNGSCLECLADKDCDTDEGEKCAFGRCERRCSVNEECPRVPTAIAGKSWDGF